VALLAQGVEAGANDAEMLGAVERTEATLEAEARVRRDLTHIGAWLKARTARPRFIIIGTHCDFDAEFVLLSGNNSGDYVDKFRKLPIVSELVARGGGTQQTKVVLGSMKTLQHTEALVYQRAG
jgi:hypothetical protein